MTITRADVRNYKAFIWHAIFLSITVTFTEVNTVIPALILRVGGRELHVGIVTAIMVSVPLISRLQFTSFLSGRAKKKPYLLVGINLRILALVLIAVTIALYERLTVTQIILLLYAELLLFTLSGSFAGLPYIDIIGSTISSERRRDFFTRKQIISSVGMLVSVLIARYILKSVEYPNNYTFLFTAAAFFLAIASIGFWRIEENVVSAVKRMSYVETLKKIPNVLGTDRNLRVYLLYSNVLGAQIALTPFFITFAKDRYVLDPQMLSSVLFLQIIGMIVSSFLWPKIVQRGGFKSILRIRAYLSVLLPAAALITGYFASQLVYIFIFFGMGSLLSARTVSEDAVIVELSEKHTRVLYLGILGTFNLIIVFLPIVLGGLISRIGYVPIFISVSVISLWGIVLTNRMVCPIDMVQER